MKTILFHPKGDLYDEKLRTYYLSQATENGRHHVSKAALE